MVQALNPKESPKELCAEIFIDYDVHIKLYLISFIQIKIRET